MRLETNTKMETAEYLWCNHQHIPTDKHTLVNIGGEEFVANNDAIPLLKALNELGLRTRTHHIDKECDHAFVSIVLDPGVQLEIRTVERERDATRNKFDGCKEVLISWRIK